MKWIKSTFALVLIPIFVGLVLDRFTNIPVFSACWTALKWVGRLFGVSLTVSVWQLILLMLAIPVVAVAGLAIALRYNRNETNYQSYTSDTFMGVIWCWRYLHGRISGEPTPRCPSCKTELDGDRVPWSNLRLTCCHCGFERVFDHDGETVLDRVFKEIDRKVVTGEYASARTD